MIRVLALAATAVLWAGLWSGNANSQDKVPGIASQVCAACHAADGSGNTTVGKALKLRDIRVPEAQTISDADLTTLIAKGKDKMPANEKSLKPEQIKALVAYTRELAQKK